MAPKKSKSKKVRFGYTNSIGSNRHTKYTGDNTFGQKRKYKKLNVIPYKRFFHSKKRVKAAVTIQKYARKYNQYPGTRKVFSFAKFRK
jgi:hypothetical protein